MKFDRPDSLKWLFALSSIVLSAMSSRAASPAAQLSQVLNPQLAECSSGCTLRLPAGDFYSMETVVLNRSGLRLIGEGAKATRIHFSGPFGSAAIDLRLRPFTIDSHSAIEGISIELDAPGTTAILTGDITSATFRDLFIECNHQPGSYGVMARLEQGWFERNLFEAVDVKYCATGLEMSLAPGARFSSFGYNKFIQFGLNLGSGQKGVVIGRGAMLYHSILNWNVNIDEGGTSDGTEFIHVEGTVQSNRYDICGESAQPSIGIRVLPGGVWKNEPESTIMLDSMTVLSGVVAADLQSGAAADGHGRAAPPSTQP